MKADQKQAKSSQQEESNKEATEKDKQTNNIE